ncbi:MAG TPA: hypothetical protein VKE96_12370 [Vicinamibacterales bacterium]|nr:hypothetical protein [Vicinamibacterales bacterium]
MPLQIPVETLWGRELARWNTPRNRNVVDSNGDEILDEQNRPIRGMGAIGFEPFPMLVYKAHKNPQGKVLCMDVPPLAEFYPDEKSFAAACERVEVFNRRCYQRVGNEQELQQALKDGWSKTAQEALEKQERLEQDIANAAAEANYAAKRLSANAQAELDAAGRETHQHVTDVVGVPRSARRRPLGVSGAPKKARRVVAEPEGR